MADHVLGLEDVVDEHEAADDAADGGVLRRVDDPAVGDTGVVKTQEVGILGEHDASLF